MSKKEKQQEEQLDLINVHPVQSKKILAAAKEYRLVVKKRLALSAQESDLKETLKELIKKENLKRLDDGSIRFKLDGFVISLEPRDELVRIEEDKDKE